jgi:hypothetical protein
MASSRHDRPPICSVPDVVLAGLIVTSLCPLLAMVGLIAVLLAAAR